MGHSATSATDVVTQAVAGTLRAVDYLRVSTEQQKKGYGIAYTGKRTSAHIRRKQWAHVDTFKDDGESGTLPWWKRPGAKEIMRLAAQTPRAFDVVVVYETRAVGRRNRVFWEWVWKLQDLGVFVAVVDDDIDNTTEEGEARMREKAEESFKELARIRKRTQGGIQEKAEIGGFPGGQPRYGYRIKNQGKKGEQELVLDVCDGEEFCSRAEPCTTVHEASVLRRARELVVQHKGNWRKAASWLNAEGFLARSGKPWSHPNLRARVMDEDLLNARYVFRSSKNARLNPDGTPIWGESIVLKLDPMFTPEEVAELRRAVAKPGRKSSRPGRIYPVSGRIVSLCGKRYVGSGPANEAPHYVCSGKREEYPGAPTCSCSQLDAEGVEQWAWSEVCGYLGDPDRLQALAEQHLELASGRQVNFASRLAELDQKIAEQEATVQIATAAAARQAAQRGLVGKEADASVDRTLKPLLVELEELHQMRGEVEAWQAEASEADRHIRDLRALARVANGRMDSLTSERQQEMYGLLKVKIKLTGSPTPMHRGLECPIGAWFRSRKRLVPELCDCAWERIVEAEGIPGGGVTPRQKGGLAPRAVLEAFLKKARTGVAWPELNAEYGSTGLIGHWKRWSASGRWERVMEALRDCGGVPAARPHPLPPMELRGRVSAGMLIAAVAGEHEGHAQESGPSAAACWTSGRPSRAGGRWSR